MDIEFDDEDLEDLYLNTRASWGLGPSVDKGFRKVMQALVAAPDERDLYALKGLHFEKLKGKRSHQRSLKINNQWRLIVEMRKEKGHTRIGVISIEDYH